MNTTSINIKIESNIKKQAQHIANELGLSLDAVIKAFLKQFIRTKKISAELDETPSKSLIAAMKKAKGDRLKGLGSPIFTRDENLIKKYPKKYMHANKMQQWLSEQGI